MDVELLAAPMVADGEPVGTFALYHDLTEVIRQRRFFEALLEVSPEAIVTTTVDDTVASWNPAAERLFGYTADEALGRASMSLAQRPDLHEEGKELDREANEGRTVRAVTQRTRKDGSVVDVDIVGGPVTVGGELVAKHVFYHDISELQEQKRYFQSLLEISPTAIVITGSTRRSSLGIPPPRSSSGTPRRRPWVVRPTTSWQRVRNFTSRRPSSRRLRREGSASRPLRSGRGKTAPWSMSSCSSCR